MSIFKTVQSSVGEIIHQLVQDGALTLTAPMPAFVVEPPRDPTHGDMATNVAMMLTKSAGKPPRAIAELIKTTSITLE